MEGNWIIEARAFKIWFTPFTHDFWVLRDAAGAVADQLHGLAVDPRTGARKAVGQFGAFAAGGAGRDDRLGAAAGQPAAAAVRGREEEVVPRWLAAVAAATAINALGLRYPDVWQHGWRPK
jgi:hypothetical protein